MMHTHGSNMNFKKEPNRVKLIMHKLENDRLVPKFAENVDYTKEGRVAERRKNWEDLGYIVTGGEEYVKNTEKE